MALNGCVSYTRSATEPPLSAYLSLLLAWMPTHRATPRVLVYSIYVSCRLLASEYTPSTIASATVSLVSSSR
jgi:hypothetical protein